MTTEVETKPVEPIEPKEPVEPTKPTEPFKSFLTQEDFDNETAKIRGNAERKTKAELFKLLGIDSEDKLEVLKKAYENSLTEQEKVSEQLKQLGVLQSKIAEQEAIIAALTKLSGKESNEVIKLVKMAKGLVGEDCTIEQALEDVLKLVQKEKEPEKPKVPESQVKITTPDTKGGVVNNPFKDGNITEMGKLIRQNPEEARKLAKLANYPVTW